MYAQQRNQQESYETKSNSVSARKTADFHMQRKQHTHLFYF